ncbi:hypothetical protein BJX63DRAFT_416889 [Aspergillus granulosus]|uniref:Uncharacterized protein n=1 Tax=Aspergillus granulosus TaxID=176169 RepID=A0ABR4GRD5_9EURO
MFGNLCTTRTRSVLLSLFIPSVLRSRRGLSGLGRKQSQNPSRSQITDKNRQREKRRGCDIGLIPQPDSPSITQRHVESLLQPHQSRQSGNVRFPTKLDDAAVDPRAAREFEFEPFPIPRLTGFILSFLQPLPEAFMESSPAYPTNEPEDAELADPIRSRRPFVNPPEECTRDLPPACWLRLVMDGQLFPWLWDLDDACLSTALTEHQWDWERLARQLAGRIIC